MYIRYQDYRRFRPAVKRHRRRFDGSRKQAPSLRRAKGAGFLALQFNFVVSTNGPAVALWKDLGFAIVGTLPRAFRHPTRGIVDAYVMYRWLGEGAPPGIGGPA